MAKLPSELTSSTLVKRVMSGSKEYRTKEYLDAFSHVPSTELYHSDYNRFEILKLWNSLQSTPNKVRYFTFSLVDRNNFVRKKIAECYSHAKWAYIFHDKDTSAERKHFHYVLLFEQPRSFASIANDLEIPVTMLQKVYSKKGILDYLTHENDPDKHHYSLSEITANFDIEEEKKDDDIDPWQEYQDYKALREGRLSIKDWFDKYSHILHILRHYNTRLQVYDRLLNAELESASYVRNGRACPRSEFPVSNPCKKSSKKSFQTGFSQIFPEQTPWLFDGSLVAIPPSQKAKVKNKKDYRKPNPRSDLS